MEEGIKITWDSLHRVSIEWNSGEQKWQAYLEYWEKNDYNQQSELKRVNLRASSNFEKAWHSISEEALDNWLEE